MAVEEKMANTQARGLLSLSTRNRLVFGFSTVSMFLVIAVATTLYNVSNVAKQTDTLVNLRLPTAEAGSSMVNNINSSLASLRGWMLTGDETFKTQRAGVWKSIDSDKDKLNELAVNWTNPENVRQWNEFEVVLRQFRSAQKAVEEIAHTPREMPATLVLTTEAVPLTEIIVDSITLMIDLEAGELASKDRKALLGVMADFRGTMGLSLANIRAYLLTGDARFRSEFGVYWTRNEHRFAVLEAQSHLMTERQQTAFEALSAARAKFAPMPQRMFAIRGSDKWNMANYTLVHEAIPRADKLLVILEGDLRSDGTRAGGMVDNQRQLLSTDAKEMHADFGILTYVEWVLLIIGVVLASAMTFFIVRALPPVYW